MEKITTAFKRQRETRTCPEHGEYESLSLTPGFWTDCRQCQEQREKEQAKAEAEAKRIEDFEAMLKYAGLGKRFMGKSFDNYQPRTAAQRRILEQVESYARDFQSALEAGRCLALIGEAGNGKTHLGVAILREVRTQGFTGRYVRAYDLFKSIKETWNSIGGKRSESEAMKDFTDPQLLVLDEIGVQFNTGTERTLLFQVIDTRYNDELPTVVISNLPKPADTKQRDASGNDWEPRQNPKDLEDAMGYRSYDRLTENGGRILEFHGASYRRLVQSDSQPDQAWQ